jgi:hypothetical protein
MSEKNKTMMTGDSRRECRQSLAKVRECRHSLTCIRVYPPFGVRPRCGMMRGDVP